MIAYYSGSQSGVHRPLSGPQKISRGPQDSKFCIMVNRRGSTEYRKIDIGGSQSKKVENRWLIALEPI